jgi:hypothetical protein
MRLLEEIVKQGSVETRHTCSFYEMFEALLGVQSISVYLRISRSALYYSSWYVAKRNKGLILHCRMKWSTKSFVRRWKWKILCHIHKDYCLSEVYIYWCHKGLLRKSPFYGKGHVCKLYRNIFVFVLNTGELKHKQKRYIAWACIVAVYGAM